MNPFLVKMIEVQPYHQLVLNDTNNLMGTIEKTLNLEVSETHANRRLFNLGLLTIKKDVGGGVQDYLLELIEERNKQIRKILNKRQSIPLGILNT